MKNRCTSQKAWEWYQRQPWLIGCNYIPNTAINQLEMWQIETFDPDTIDYELNWAATLGFNTIRVYLHDLLWDNNSDGFRARINSFLTIASNYKIRPIFVIFDDCWNNEFSLGKQPTPRSGVHNSGWVKSPGKLAGNNPLEWNRLEHYVKGLLSAFGNDDRILAWDLYNEPGNDQQDEKSLPLLKATFEWAWSIRPSQPLTAGIWYNNPTINEFQSSASDIISFHSYESTNSLEELISLLKQYDRPLICTEYMARTRGSCFHTHLPIFKRERIGCLNWGLVAGKTNTIFAWDAPLDVKEPPVWFHDIFRKDGSPYSQEEVDFIRQTTKNGK